MKYDKKFWRCAGERALHTLAQTVLSMLVVGVPITGFDWKNIVLVALTASIMSLLKSVVTGCPEAITA